MRRTYHWRPVTRLLAAMAASGVLAFTGTLWATTARADVPLDCQTTTGFWLFHGTARTLCDGPVQADGSWTRWREFFTPAHTTSASSYCSGGAYYSSCTFTPARYVERASNGIEQYVVFPDTVLPDEPGHI